MICNSCQREARMITYSKKYGEHCNWCMGVSEASGAKTTGALTRQSFRIRSEQPKHEGDMVQPERYDKHAGKFVPNPDFIKLYPDNAKNFFTPEQIKTAKMPKLADRMEKQIDTETAHRVEQKTKVTSSGSAKKAIKKMVRGE